MIASSRSKTSPEPLIVHRQLEGDPGRARGSACSARRACSGRRSGAAPAGSGSPRAGSVAQGLALRRMKGTSAQRQLSIRTRHLGEGLGLLGRVHAARRRSRAPARTWPCRRCSARAPSRWRSRPRWACGPRAARRPCGRAGRARGASAAAPSRPAPSPAAGGSGSCRAARPSGRSSWPASRARVSSQMISTLSMCSRSRIGLEDAVGEAQAEHVLHGLLLEEVIDAVDRASGAAVARRAFSSCAEVRSWPKGFSMTIALPRASSPPRSHRSRRRTPGVAGEVDHRRALAGGERRGEGAGVTGVAVDVGGRPRRTPWRPPPPSPRRAR